MDTKKLVNGYSHTEREMKLEDAGRGIYSYRRRKGLTQESLGRLLSMDKSQISKLEKAGNPTVSTLQKAFGVMGADVRLRVSPALEDEPKEFLDDLIALIDSFAVKHDLSSVQAFNYLERFGAIDFYLTDPQLEMELPVDDTLDAFEKICLNNGGELCGNSGKVSGNNGGER